MPMLKIGLAQTRQSSSFEKNAETIFRFVEQAGAAGVQILCFPETQTVGYRVDITPTDAPVEPKKLDDVHARIARRCGELGMACILGTETPLASDPLGGKPYNSALVISPQGKVLGVHHKTKLTPLDAIAYTAGEGFEVFDLFGVKVGVVICYEGFRFAHTTRDCVSQGAQLVFHPQNNTTRPNDWKIPVHHAMAVTRAAENTIWFASCNICHDQHQNCRSMVIGPDGLVKAQAELKQEQLVVADIDTDLATRAMYKFDIGEASDDDCAKMLFAGTVKKEEYKAA
jgi:ribosomal-protein-alanine N-acetyltransferase